MARTAAETGSDVAMLDILSDPVEDLAEMERSFNVRARYYQ